MDTEGFQKGINKALASSKRVKDIAKELDISTSNVRAALSKAGAVRGGTDQLKNIKQQQFFLRELRKEAGLDVAALRQLDNALLKVRQSLRTEGLRLRIGNNAFNERNRLQGLVSDNFNPNIGRKRLQVLKRQGKINDPQLIAGLREIDQRVAASATGINALIGRLGVLKTVFIGIISARLLGFFFELGSSLFELNKNVTNALATFGRLEQSQISQLTTAALAAGTNLTFSASSVQAAAALEQLARDGNTAEQAIAKLGPTLQFAEAIQLDFGETANKIGDVTEALNITLSEYQNTLNQIALAQRLGTATGQDLLDALIRVSPQARAANVSVKELIATLTTLGNRGLKGVTAGENLGRAIVVAQESFIKNQAKFRQEGISVFDADRDGAVGLLKLIKELESALVGLTPQQKFAKLSGLFDDKRNVKFILTLIGASRDIEENLKRLDKEAGGESARQAAERLTGFQRLAKVVLGSFQTLGTGVSGVFDKILKSLLPAESITTSVTATIIKGTAAVLAGAAAFGAVTLAIKSVTLAYIGLQSVLTIAGLAGIGVALANPLTWVAIAAGVGAATAALIALNREVKIFARIDFEKNLQGIEDQAAIAKISAENKRLEELQGLREKLLTQTRGQNRGLFDDKAFRKQIATLQEEANVLANIENPLSKILLSRDEGFEGVFEDRVSLAARLLSIVIQLRNNETAIAEERERALRAQRQTRLEKLLEGGINFTKFDEDALGKAVDRLFDNLKTPSEILKDDLDIIKEIIASQKLFGLFPEFTQSKLNQAAQSAIKKFEEASQKQTITVNTPAETFGSAAGFRTRFEITRALEEDVNTPILQSQVEQLKLIDKNAARQVVFLQQMSEFFNAETARAFAALSDPAGAQELILRATFAGL